MAIKNNLQKKRLLSEAKKAEDIANVIGKNNPNINVKELSELLISGDPTSNDNGEHGKFVGKYWKWISNLYINGSIKIGDSIELRHAINIFDKNKTTINAKITDFNDLSSLVNFISENNLDDSFKSQKQVSKAEQGLETVYEDEYFKVVIPHTYEASRKIGGDTHWCTASSNDYYYNFYKNKYGGEYYVIIKKQTGEKFQFHPESNQLMNKNDRKVTFNDISTNSKEGGGLIKFFSDIVPDFSNFFKGIFFDDFIDAISSSDDKFSLCKKYCEVVPVKDLPKVYFIIVFSGIINVFNALMNDFVYDKWAKIYNTFYVFDDYEPFTYQYYIVDFDNGKYGILSYKTGGFIEKDQFDSVNFFNKIFTVSKNGKYNFIFNEKYISDTWFDKVSNYSSNEYTSSVLDNKAYLISKNGVIPTEYTEIKVMKEENGIKLATVYKNKMVNLIKIDDLLNHKRNYILDEWLDDLFGDSFKVDCYNIYFVLKNRKYNVLSVSQDYTYNFESKIWFDDFFNYDYKTKSVDVIVDGKKKIFSLEDGEFYDKK